MKLKFKFTRKRIIIGLIVVVIAGGSYYWYKKSHAASSENQYKTETVQKGTLTASVSESGNVIVDQSATVDPTITGTVANLAVNIGDEVKKGQILFTIINDQLSIDSNQAKISYLQSQGSLESAQASKKQADYNLDHNTGGSANKEILKKKVEAAKISLEAAKQDVSLAKAKYQNALSDAAKRNVTSPIDGTVNEINIKNGDDLSRLSSSSNSSAPIIIGDLNTLKAQVAVNEVDITNVEIGQKVTLTFDAIPDFSTTGKVEKIDSLGTISSGVVTYDVTIGFDNLDSRIKPEMSVTANIITNVKQDILYVPNNAIKTQGNNTYVEVLNSGNTPVNTTVTTGISNSTDTEIVSGLSIGDNVVTQTISSSSTSGSSSSSSRTSSGLHLPGLGGGRD